ncbi:hypothetical protein SCAR479_04968 [Seiridium cardinale]|uniref:Uncharacterized protein n=1 Tax=Seiridium cardinale TaxID=138064 RepID=A0ABR2Y5E0_9PEZI
MLKPSKCMGSSEEPVPHARDPKLDDYGLSSQPFETHPELFHPKALLLYHSDKQQSEDSNLMCSFEIVANKCFNPRDDPTVLETMESKQYIPSEVTATALRRKGQDPDAYEYVLYVAKNINQSSESAGGNKARTGDVDFTEELERVMKSRPITSDECQDKLWNLILDHTKQRVKSYVSDCAKSRRELRSFLEDLDATLEIIRQPKSTQKEKVMEALKYQRKHCAPFKCFRFEFRDPKSQPSWEAPVKALDSVLNLAKMGQAIDSITTFHKECIQPDHRNSFRIERVPEPTSLFAETNVRSINDMLRSHRLDPMPDCLQASNIEKTLPHPEKPYLRPHCEMQLFDYLMEESHWKICLGKSRIGAGYRNARIDP